MTKILVANRGEIACRILRTLKRLGIPSVAMYSEPDRHALHVRMADEAVAIGPAPVGESYLRGDAIIAAAKQLAVSGIHPGYGLLSENAEFAAACENEGIAFIGPTPAQIRDFGLKHRARELAEAAGVAICPGTSVLASIGDAQDAAQAIGYPVLLKATAGGGGIGMRLCHDDAELAREYDRVQRLAGAHFGNAELFLEKYVERARHVEVQIFGDGQGRVITLGERDCSLQRRRQKVVEEAPAANLDAQLVEELNRAAQRLGAAVQYRSAGTIEFLVDADAGVFYFLEVNTRLQVEHCVTEEICGVDLVEWMVRLAQGDSAPLREYRHQPRGHAIEVRLYAEDPARDFRPCSGTLTTVSFPADARIESWVEPGSEVSPFYDPLLAKIVCWGEDRRQAIAKLVHALSATTVAGIQTNLRYLRAILAWSQFTEHRHHTRSLAELAFVAGEIEVIQPGDMTTVQDYPGRLGYWDVGVPPSGPMDWLALRIGNRILGNIDGAPGLEITMRGPTVRFDRAVVVCVTGAPIEVTVDGFGVAMWQPLTIAAGALLRLGAIADTGARAYLTVRGGIDVPPYLGSCSTFTLGGFGGHCGRALRADDVIPLADPEDPSVVIDQVLDGESARRLAPLYSHQWQLRVIDGPHTSPEFFTPADIDRFYGEGFEVHYQSARTGVRLVGPKPSWARRDGGEAGLHPSNIHDTAYSVGSIDYTGDMPVILGPDGPSLGGFVCPAVVIQADRWKLGQLRAGDRVTFHAVDADEAVAIHRRQEQSLAHRNSGSSPLSQLGDGGESAQGLEPEVSEHPLPNPPPLPELATGEGSTGRPRGVIATKAARADRPAVTYRASGDRHLLIEFGPMVLDIDLRVRVQLLWNALREQISGGDVRGIIDLTPGIRSLQVHYDPTILARNELLALLEQLEDELPSGRGVSLPTRIVLMPLSWDDPATQEAIDKYMRVVRDDAPWCPRNIEFIRRINGLDSEDEVRRIVFDASYLVLGLGDVYLGAPVATPVDPRHRLVTTKYNPARTWTPENAVGIGGAYMCIYGMEGPGGYQFVGRTVPVWNTYKRWRADNPWLLRFFDQIRFFPVTAAELLEYRAGVRDGSIEIKIEESVFDLDQHHRFLRSIEPTATTFRARQQTAFAEERERWRASGELEAATRAAADFADQPAAAHDELPEGCVAVTAPMGAQVWKVSVAVGDRVAEQQEVCVLAAMKMETPLAAPHAGLVQAVLCREGQVVSAGAPLVILKCD